MGCSRNEPLGILWDANEEEKEDLKVMLSL